MPKTLLYKSLNIILFYLGWFYLISTAIHGHPYQGLFATACILLFHFMMSKSWVKELLILISVVIIGFCFDTAYASFGLLSYVSPNPISPHLAPLWILALYALFATSLNSSLSWLRNQPIISMVLGSIGASLAYFFAIRLGAASCPSEATTLSIIALVWFLATPCFFAITRFFDKTLSSR